MPLSGPRNGLLLRGDRFEMSTLPAHSALSSLATACSGQLAAGAATGALALSDCRCPTVVPPV